MGDYYREIWTDGLDVLACTAIVGVRKSFNICNSRILRKRGEEDECQEDNDIGVLTSPNGSSLCRYPVFSDQEGRY